MAEGLRAEGVYEFGDYRLLAAQRRLIARSDGRPIELTQKALDALHFLLQHPGELLDKSTLMAAVWPNVVVEENNLNQVISALRRALGDGSGGRRFVVTVPGRGYQFVAPVREVRDSAPSPSPSPSPAVHAPAGDRASIAVLPFASLSSDPEKDYFGDGIAEELIHLLARVPGLKVPARTSSFAYKGRNVDVRQIARQLGVGMLLEGSVRSAGDSIRVTAQLVDAESGYHIWSHTFDRQFADVFRLQDELAGAIVQRIEPSLGSVSTPALQQDDPPTRNVEAYRLYLQGRATFFSSGLTLDSIERIVEMMERSLALDSNFARAHALRGYALATRVQLGSRGPDKLDQAMQEAERALALDPQLADAHMLHGMLQAGRGEWLAADASFRRAIALDPKEPGAYLSHAVYVLGAVGRLHDAIEQGLRSYHLAPAMVGAVMTVGGLYQLVGQDEVMERYLRVLNDLGAAPQAAVPIFRSQAARRAGRYAEAAELMTPVLPAGVRAAGGEDVVRLVYHAFGDVATTGAAVSSLRALYARLDPPIAEGWPMAILGLNWYVLLGAMDDAYEIAQRFVTQFEHARHLSNITLMPVWLPELAAFRGDPRFHEFTARLGLHEYWKANGPPDGYALHDGHLVAHQGD
jgi:TolB-like protein/tetratricopeptide (TPR) repeat protein